MLVLEFHSVVDPDEIHRNGMLLLDGSARTAVVAFSDDPALAIFHSRLAEYRGDVPEGQKAARYESFFDAVVEIRPFGPSERISPALAAYVEGLEEPEELRLDVRCWHPENAGLATEWIRDCRNAAEEAGGRVASVYQNDSAGILLARIFLSSARLLEFAEIDVIASIDRLPVAELSIADFHSLDADSMPEVAEPGRSAPILGLIDSGVASAHPLLAGSILAAEALSPHIVDGEDRHGHGTMVASLALHGHIPSALRQDRLVPIAKVVSVAVLDSDAAFPDSSLWESDLADAIAYCAEMGAKVINLSLGDPTRPFIPRRQPAIASIVDQLARLLDLVVVVSAGNSDPGQYLGTHHDPTTLYVADLLNHPDTGIVPPGTAALALTVGGIGTSGAAGGFIPREPVERRPFGSIGWPSTVTRRGLGVEEATKPELVAASGTHAFEPGRHVTDVELSVIGAATRRPGRILGADIGTSYAAPLVARVALGILSRFPDFSANLVRALTLLGASPTWDGSTLTDADGELKESARRQAVRKLIGYGQPSLEDSLLVTPHRAVLVAEGEIAMDSVHIYELPVPHSFYETGGCRYVDVALAFDPPARSQRLDYLGNKIECYLVRNIELAELVEVFTKYVDDDSLDELDNADESGEPEHVGDPAAGAEEVDEVSTKATRSNSLGSVLGSRLVSFDSSVTERSRSANQLARKTFSKRWNESAGGGAFLVIRSLNRWCDSAFLQSYSMAVSLRRDPSQPEIYAELAVRLEAVVEIELEAELEQ